MSNYTFDRIKKGNHAIAVIVGHVSPNGHYDTKDWGLLTWDPGDLRYHKCYNWLVDAIKIAETKLNRKFEITTDINETWSMLVKVISEN
jgi:hypothetical protein